MFSLLWRFLPGPAWVRIIVLVLVAAALVWALIEWVYPWVNVQFPEQEVTVGS